MSDKWVFRNCIKFWLMALASNDWFLFSEKDVFPIISKIFMSCIWHCTCRFFGVQCSMFWFSICTNQYKTFDFGSTSIYTEIKKACLELSYQFKTWKNNLKLEKIIPLKVSYDLESVATLFRRRTTNWRGFWWFTSRIQGCHLCLKM